MQNATKGFSELKVLDFTGELGPYTGKMFAGLGASVILVEPISGSRLRRVGPFFQNRPGQDTSLPHLYFNGGKRSLALNLAGEHGRWIFRDLCTRVDLLIESAAPGYLDGLGLSYEVLSKDNKKLVQTSITPFGRSGPLSGCVASDITCAALSGFLHLAGVDDDKPVRAPDNQSYRMAEAYAAVGSAIALYDARRTGQGQVVDVACVEACAMALESSPQHWDLEGKIRRGRGREAANGSIHPCKDGFIVLAAIVGNSRGSWEAFINWMRAEDADEWMTFQDEKWLDSRYRASPEGFDTFCRIFERYASKCTKSHLYETGQTHKVAISPLSNGKDLLENRQLNHRRFWQRIPNDRLGADITYPGAPYEFSEMKWRFGTNAPGLGQHTFEILQEIGFSDSDAREYQRLGIIHAQ